MSDEDQLIFRLSTECSVTITFHGRPTAAAIEKLVLLLRESADTYPADAGAPVQPDYNDEDGSRLNYDLR